MIVRNEAHVIGELLASVAQLIDTWVIVDTGSTDGTPDLIRSLMAELGIPGELFQRPWRDFGTNRSEALALCEGRADYFWMIDADDRLVGDLDLTGLVHDGYFLRYGKDFAYWRQQIFKAGSGWHYRGVLHEYACADRPTRCVNLEGDYYIESGRTGARSRVPDKYRRDAETFERALEAEPGNERYWFYLGQSWYDAGELERARSAYQQRAAMGGWEEELFYARFKLARCLENLAAPEVDVVAAYLNAFETRPTRAEPLHDLALFYRRRGELDLAYLFARQAAAIPFPREDRLFVHADVYRFRALDEVGISAWYAGRMREGYEACQQLLASDQLPAEERPRVESNLAFYLGGSSSGAPVPAGNA